MKLSDDLEWLHADDIGGIGGLKRELLSKGEQLIDLSMINPDQPPAQLLQDRLVEACVKPNNHRYSVSRGVRKLREAFAEKYQQAFDVGIDPGTQLCISLGAKDGLAKTLRCFPRDSRVLLLSPTYPMHLASVKLQGFDYDTVDLSRDPKVFLNRLQAKLSSHSFNIVLLNFPQNPTGICFERESLNAILELCYQHGATVINDFVYGELTNSGVCAPSMIGLESSHDNVIELYSLSKVLGIPGWRVAAVVGSTGFIDTLSKLKQHADYGIFLPLQLAVAGVLPESRKYALQMAKEYARRAEIFGKGLQRIGWEVSLPEAGACIWGMLPRDWGYENAVHFASDLLRKEKVAIVPGEAFGKRYDQFVRFALVRPEFELREVLSRLRRLAGLKDESFGVSAVETLEGVNSQ